MIARRALALLVALLAVALPLAAVPACAPQDCGPAAASTQGTADCAMGMARHAEAAVSRGMANDGMAAHGCCPQRGPAMSTSCCDARPAEAPPARVPSDEGTASAAGAVAPAVATVELAALPTWSNAPAERPPSGAHRALHDLHCTWRI